MNLSEHGLSLLIFVLHYFMGTMNDPPVGAALKKISNLSVSTPRAFAMSKVILEAFTIQKHLGALKIKSEKCFPWVVRVFANVHLNSFSSCYAQ